MKSNLILFNKKIGRLTELFRRGWRIYIHPPKETKEFLDVQKLPISAKCVEKTHTVDQPKQVVVSKNEKLAIVSGMKGHTLQFFDLTESRLKLIDEIPFKDQCVETTVSDELCFVTTSNFARGRDIRNHLHIVDLTRLEVVGSVSTGGNWSKVIAIHEPSKLAFVSNWHSNDISIINISDPSNLHLIQVLPCGKSPRGIAITNSGDRVVVAGFYSSDISELRKEKDGLYRVVYTSNPFDSSKYLGNMRDVLISPDDKLAYVSNMGRNLVLVWDLENREFITGMMVGKFPNTLCFANDTGELLLVSCRESNAICIIDTKSLSVVSRSENTGSSPTGLCPISGGFLVTGFATNTLERYRFVKSF